MFCIRSFNTNISHQLLGYKITYMNSQLENTNSNGDLICTQRDGCEMFVLKLPGIKIYIMLNQGTYYLISPSINQYGIILLIPLCENTYFCIPEIFITNVSNWF